MKNWTQKPHIRIINNKEVVAGRGGQKKKQDSIFDDFNTEISQEIVPKKKEDLLLHPIVLEMPKAHIRIFKEYMDRGVIHAVRESTGEKLVIPRKEYNDGSFTKKIAELLLEGKTRPEIAKILGMRLPYV